MSSSSNKSASVSNYIQFLECTSSDSLPLLECEQKKHSYKSVKSTLEREPNLNLAIIGNCAFSALLDPFGCFVWCCMPQFDSSPIFNALLGGNEVECGFWDVVIEDFDYSQQAYIRNTAIVVTTLFDKKGRAVQITDFAPRFSQNGRQYRPSQIIRQIKPLYGRPRVTIRFRPSSGYTSQVCTAIRGTNHLSYDCEDFPCRLTTDMPVSFIIKEVSFFLEQEHFFILGVDEPLAQAPKTIALDFFEKTFEWWDFFSRALSVPYEWQSAVIRAAITLKLCQFEESGAIIAAMTTSIPEAANTPRTWDYRFCWLRDAFHTVRALNRLSETRTMEAYIRFISNIAASYNHSLQPLYGVLFETDLPEKLLDTLPGYRGMGPVRVGNAAFTQLQNDNAGAVLMAVTQCFVDVRITGVGTDELYESLQHIAISAFETYNHPDAGIWELRGVKRVHTFSVVMCWVCCYRMAFISGVLNKLDRQEFWSEKAKIIKDEIMDKGWDEKQQAFIATMDDTSDDMDAALLLLAEVQFVEASDPKFISTVEAIGRKLKRGHYLLRYTEDDDFGAPENAFNICTFWYIDALASIGRKEEARIMFQNMLSMRNHVGILSEDLNTETGELWGNYPQTYSMCGIINSAMKLSKSWSEFGL